MPKQFLLFTVTILLLATTIFAQEKYAVLITGDYAAKNIPADKQWGGGSKTYECFWYDTFLMWEMLLEKGYTQENIIVLFADGIDYPSTPEGDYVVPRYRPPALVTVTDYAATHSNVDLVFEGLANGSNGFPEVKQEDFLFVWTFDHGDGDLQGNSYLYLLNGDQIWDYEFANALDQINSNKKVIWMQQCLSGGFVDDCENENTYIITACNYDEYAQHADDQPDIEHEELGNPVIWYNHGEFNFHIYSASMGLSPGNQTTYNGEPYTNADSNNDNIISVSESGNWEVTHESKELETPQVSDIGEIGDFTSLEYPAIINNSYLNIVNNEAIGICAITENIIINESKSLEIMNNSRIHFLNNCTLTVAENSSLILNENISFISENNPCKIEISGNF